MAEVALTVLKPFLNFVRTFEPQNAHNMLAIILDPRYKGLQSVSKFVGPTNAKKVVVEYDAKVLMPMLHKAFAALTPPVEGIESEVVVEPSSPAEIVEFVLFGSPASEEEDVEEQIVKELSLFRRLVFSWLFHYFF
jgi:hypothetical protein